MNLFLEKAYYSTNQYRYQGQDGILNSVWHEMEQIFVRIQKSYHSTTRYYHNIIEGRLDRKNNVLNFCDFGTKLVCSIFSYHSRLAIAGNSLWLIPFL